MTYSRNMDTKDQQIIELLQHDSSLSTYKIAKKTLIPQTTVLHRIRKLKEQGIIKRFTVDGDFHQLGKKVKALIFVKVNKEMEKGKYGKVGDIEAQILKHPLVLNVKRLMGKHDFVIETVTQDIEELNQFLITNVRSLNAVAETDTVVVLQEWKK